MALRILIHGLLLGLLSLPAGAQTAQGIDQDLEFGTCRISASIDTVRKSCTAFIDSGRGTDADRAIALTNRARVNRNTVEAIADLDRAIRLDPTHAAAYFERGRANDQRGEVDRAMADYGEVVRLKPDASGRFDSDYIYALYYRGMLHERKNEPEKALADYGEVIKFQQANPKVFTTAYPEAYYLRGAIHETMGRRDDAVADYRQALALSARIGGPHPKSKEALARLGVAP